MTGPEHFAKAEELLGQAEQLLQGDKPSAATWSTQQAQVHALLALAAANAGGTGGADRQAWEHAGAITPSGPSPGTGAPASSRGRVPASPRPNRQ